jgi:hypothetical protein
MEPSDSSTSATNRSGPPIRALAKGWSASAKFFITAPFITVGLRPAECRIQATMPVMVDLPLVPATPTEVGAALNSCDSSWGRVTMVAPARFAAPMSGTVSSMAPVATTICPARVTPDPSCGCRVTPCARSQSNLAGVRPWSSALSEPSMALPRA